MNVFTWLPVILSGLFFGMLVLLEVGRRAGAKRLALDSDQTRRGFGTIEGAVFGLLGLLIAFTFSGAVARWDTRRQLIVEEANAIGTAYLRLDVLPVAAQPKLRELFRGYVDSRLESYAKLPDVEAAKKELAHSLTLQGDIWSQAVAACQEPGRPERATLVLPALNQMIDITTTRAVAAQTHPPLIIHGMLAALALVSALLAGYGMAGGRRGWLHEVAFSAMITGTVYVIIEIEYPRMGWIRIDAYDQVLRDVRQGMN